MRFRALVLISALALAACSSGPAPEALAPTAAPAASSALTATTVPSPSPQPTTTPAPSPTPEPRRAEVVRSRGKLICGVEGERPGFAQADDQGKLVGIDVDICRAVAAAVLDKSDAVEVRALSRRELLVALKGGAVDLIGSTAVMTTDEELAGELVFAPIIFDDGLALMSMSTGALTSFNSRKDPSVCVVSASPAEQALASYFLSHGQTVTTVVFGNRARALEAYAEGSCGALAGSRIELAAERLELADPASHLILDGLLTNAPRAPATLGDDPQWYATVSAVVSATIAAETLEVSSENLDRQLKSDEPAVRQLLSSDGGATQQLPLPRDFAARAIRDVGNYGEIYDRYLGPTTALDIPRLVVPDDSTTTGQS